VSEKLKDLRSFDGTEEINKPNPWLMGAVFSTGMYCLTAWMDSSPQLPSASHRSAKELPAPHGSRQRGAYGGCSAYSEGCCRTGVWGARPSTGRWDPASRADNGAHNAAFPPPTTMTPYFSIVEAML
jgi:hypothetical protein